MKSLLLLSLALAASASDYSAICPSKDGTTQTLPHGYQYKYVCGKAGKLSTNYATFGGMDTVEKCATACQESAQCKGSVWSPIFKTCRLFSSAEPGPRAIGEIFLPVIDRGTDPEEELKQCQADLEQTKSDCAKDRTALNIYRQANQACLDGDYELDGYQYRVICNQYPEPLSNIALYTADFTTCARKCRDFGDRCTGFEYYVEETEQCLLLEEKVGETHQIDWFGITVARKE